MTVGAPIDASIRRAALVSEARGNIVPDSSSKLAEVPELVMEPGVERLVLKFADGLGLTDDYGNVYDGYGAAGGSSLTVSSTPPSSIDDDIDDADDGDILVFDDSTEKYVPTSLLDAQVPKWGGTPAAGDFMQYDTGGIYQNRNYTEAKLIETDGSSASEGDIWVTDSGGQAYPVPQIITDYVTVIIEKPVDRTYDIALSMPFDIFVTDIQATFEGGGGTPTVTIVNTGGIVAFGDPMQLVVTDTDDDTVMLVTQVTFTRNLLIA